MIKQHLPYLLLSFSLLMQSCQSTAQVNSTSQAAIEMGAARTDQYLPLLKDKSVALLVNQTSIVEETHLVDLLLKKKVTVTKVFAPEHGFRGKADAGAHVKSGKDEKTGLPIISLYGSNKKPTADQLSDVDVVIFDIQDVGTRFYTYISSMHYVMQACAEQGKEMLVLDRPNPNGMYVDGPVLEMENQSFVGMHPIPIVHGLTVGELANMINQQGWLGSDLQCDLTVIPMQHYSHDSTYSLPVKPSPNLPNDLSIALYPSLCLFEGTEISVGRGTMKPFQQIGHPSLTDYEDGFTPESIEGMSKYPPHENEQCFGIQFNNGDLQYKFSLSYLIEFYQAFEPKKDFFNNFFVKLAGTASLQQQIEAGFTEEEIRLSWKQELENYKALRKQYLLYPDFKE